MTFVCQVDRDGRSICCALERFSCFHQICNMCNISAGHRDETELTEHHIVSNNQSNQVAGSLQLPSKGDQPVHEFSGE